MGKPTACPDGTISDGKQCIEPCPAEGTEVTLDAKTGSHKHAGTGGKVVVSFYVPCQGAWTDELTFFDRVSRRASVAQTFQLPGNPDRVNVKAKTGDGWQMESMTVSASERSATVCSRCNKWFDLSDRTFAIP